MKPKTLDEILECVETNGIWIGHANPPNAMSLEEAKAQIIELFKGCVPENPYCLDSDKFDLFRDCRSQTLENMENLK